MIKKEDVKSRLMERGGGPQSGFGVHVVRQLDSDLSTTEFATREELAAYIQVQETLARYGLQDLR